MFQRFVIVFQITIKIINNGQKRLLTIAFAIESVN